MMEKKLRRRGGTVDNRRRKGDFKGGERRSGGHRGTLLDGRFGAYRGEGEKKEKLRD